MTIMFHPNIKRIFIGNGLLRGFAGSSAITVYSGVAPTAAEITANWETYNSAAANYLAHFEGGSWTQPSDGNLLQLTALPTATPVRSDNAAWAILWASNVTKLQSDGVVLPEAKFIVASVTLATGNGVIRFNDLAFIASTPKTILDGSVGCI